jgi:phage tail-like protein
VKKSRIEQLLPDVFRRTAQEGSPLDALLSVMEDLQAPSEETLDCLAEYLHPHRTPEWFLSYLGSWVALEPVYNPNADPSQVPISTGAPALRELVANAAALAQWRGTHRGLERFLKAATGVDGFRIDDAVRDPDTGQVRAFHIRIEAPLSLKPHRALLERVIRFEKPAYVTFELSYPSDANSAGTE